jgi:hypothetical protein
VTSDSSQLNIEPLMEAIVDTVLFLELSDEQIVDEDAAVRMLEQIATTLQTMDAETNGRFLQYLKVRAERTESSNQRQAIENLASDLGLDSD